LPMAHHGNAPIQPSSFSKVY